MLLFTLHAFNSPCHNPKCIQFQKILSNVYAPMLKCPHIQKFTLIYSFETASKPEWIDSFDTFAQSLTFWFPWQIPHLHWIVLAQCQIHNLIIVEEEYLWHIICIVFAWIELVAHRKSPTNTFKSNATAHNRVRMNWTCTHNAKLKGNFFWHSMSATKITKKISSVLNERRVLLNNPNIRASIRFVAFTLHQSFISLRIDCCIFASVYPHF